MAHPGYGPRRNRRGPRSRVRNWVFVWNNPDFNDLEFPDYVSYAFWQREIGESKTEHLQGYLQCSRAVDLGTLKKWNKSMHFEPAGGDLEENKVYCSKEEGRLAGPWEYGQPKRQGKRTDLDTVAEQIREGKAVVDVADLFPSQYIRYYRGIERYKSLRGAPLRPNLRVIIYWGESGSGKTGRADWEFPPPGACKVRDNPSGWMGNYLDQETIIFDEFASEGRGRMPLDIILQLCSHGRVVLDVKGGHCNVYADTIVFTSNYSPDQWYDAPAWQRRLGEPWCQIVEMKLPRWMPPVEDAAMDAEMRMRLEEAEESNTEVDE